MVILMKRIFFFVFVIAAILICGCRPEKVAVIAFFFDNPYAAESEKVEIDRILVLDLAGNILQNIQGGNYVTGLDNADLFTVYLTEAAKNGFVIEFLYRDNAERTLEIKTYSDGTALPMQEGRLLFAGTGTTRVWRVLVNDFELSRRPDEEQVNAKYNQEFPSKLIMPLQYLSVGYLFDENELMYIGILMYNSTKSTYILGGSLEISPYLTATQAIESRFNDDNEIKSTELLYSICKFDMPDGFNFNSSDLEKAKITAYKWLIDNAKPIGENILVWPFSYPNTYNDLEQPAGWVSAFPQKYVIDAFIYHDNKEFVEKAANAYFHPTSDGGVTFFGTDGTVWFEEVPNNSHILNAHIASLNTLSKVGEYLSTDKYDEIYHKALKSLEDTVCLGR